MKWLAGLLLACAAGLLRAQDIARAALPAEGREVLSLIASGGPFPYRRDGVVFNNYEQRLPERRRGYYREYTVPTPGAATRGARRIVCGGHDTRRPDTCWYTADHYRSFLKIVE